MSSTPTATSNAMVELSIVLGLVVLALSGVAYLLGFRIGSERWRSEVTRIKSQSADAARRMHDLTRDAFVAMTEHADRRSS
jgi:uncharacterized protein (UPF0333 family)